MATTEPVAIPANLKTAKGTTSGGGHAEKPGILATFVKDPSAVTSVHYFPSKERNGCVFVSVNRSLWFNWKGYLSPAQFDALRTIVAAEKFGAF